MNRTKPLSIAIAASFIYVAWLSMSLSGALQQIEKSALRKILISQLRLFLCLPMEVHLLPARLKIRKQQQTARTKPTHCN